MKTEDDSDFRKTNLQTMLRSTSLVQGEARHLKYSTTGRCGLNEDLGSSYCYSLNTASPLKAIHYRFFGPRMALVKDGAFIDIFRLLRLWVPISSSFSPFVPGL